MTKEKAEKIMTKINNLERFFSKFERQNKEVTLGLLKVRRNLQRYF